MSETSLATAGPCHRVAVAIEDFDGAMALWRDGFGFGTMIDVVDDDLDDSRMGIVWAGNMPLLALSSRSPEGTVGRYLTRNGPSVQSLAWEVDDMWDTDARLRRAGITITGVHVEGRHFFMHPKDTFGLLLEFTDDKLPRDPRHAAEDPLPSSGTMPVEAIAHVTAVVADLDEVMTRFDEIFGDPIEVRPAAEGDTERVATVQIGDLVVRLVEALDESSRYAGVARDGLGRLHSVAFSVSDLAEMADRLQTAGIGIVDRDESTIWTDPADTQGIAYAFVA